MFTLILVFATPHAVEDYDWVFATVNMTLAAHSLGIGELRGNAGKVTKKRKLNEMNVKELNLNKIIKLHPIFAYFYLPIIFFILFYFFFQ